jgi:hypothetical protein
MGELKGCSQVVEIPPLKKKGNFRFFGIGESAGLKKEEFPIFHIGNFRSFRKGTTLSCFTVNEIPVLKTIPAVFCFFYK